MRRNHCLLIVVFGLVLSASADVRVFVTTSNDPYGLDIEANAFRPTWGNGRDFSDGHFTMTNYPPIDAPSGTPANPVVIDGAAGDFAYIWLQFRDEQPMYKVNGLVVEIADYGTGTPAQDVYTNYYMQDDSQGLGYRRWDGTATPPNYPEWHHNPQTLVGVTGDGLPLTWSVMVSTWNMYAW
jgi:hypothetical protein